MGEDNPSEIELRQMISLYQQTIYGIALTRLSNRQDADEVFQEVCLVYYQKRPVFNEEEHRKAWLIKTTLLCTKKAVRLLKRQRTDSLNEFIQEIRFSQPEEHEVYSAIMKLSVRYRMVVYLFYFEGYSSEEISTLLKISPGAVRVRLVRARQQLRQSLKGDYWDET